MAHDKTQERMFRYIDEARFSIIALYETTADVLDDEVIVKGEHVRQYIRYDRNILESALIGLRNEVEKYPARYTFEEVLDRVEMWTTSAISGMARTLTYYKLARE